MPKTDIFFSHSNENEILKDELPFAFIFQLFFLFPLFTYLRSNPSEIFLAILQTYLDYGFSLALLLQP